MLTLCEHNAREWKRIVAEELAAASKKAGVMCACGTEMMYTDGLLYVESPICFYKVVCPACGNTGKRIGQQGGE